MYNVCQWPPFLTVANSCRQDWQQKQTIINKYFLFIIINKGILKACTLYIICKDHMILILTRRCLLVLICSNVILINHLFHNHLLEHFSMCRRTSNIFHIPFKLYFKTQFECIFHCLLYNSIFPAKKNDCFGSLGWVIVSGKLSENSGTSVKYVVLFFWSTRL